MAAHGVVRYGSPGWRKVLGRRDAGRLLSLALLVCWSPAAAQAPDTLVVPLTREADGGPFTLPLWGLHPVQDGEPPAGTPDSLAHLEHYAWAVHDTSGADATADFVIGRDTRGHHVIIVDTDNDGRLDDETALVLPDYRLTLMREAAADTLPTIPVEIERGHGVARWTEAAHLRVSPYVNAPDGTPWERAEGQAYYFASALRHAWGRMPSGDTVYVGPTSPRLPISSTHGVRVRFSGMDAEEEDYRADDIAAVGSRAYRVGIVSADETAIRLVEEPGGVPEVGLRVGRLAPDFTLHTEAGDSLRLVDLRGRYVLLDFWGTWCLPCRRQTPFLKEVAAAYGPEQLLIVGIADDDPEAVRTYVDEQRIGWPQVVEGRERPKPIHDLYQVNQWPSTFLIDPDGRIIRKRLYKDMAEQVAEHLGPPETADR